MNLAVRTCRSCHSRPSTIQLDFDLAEDIVQMMEASTSIRERVVEALIAFSGKDPRQELDRQAEMSDFGLDSLAQFNFLMSLEDLFEFQIPEAKFTLENLGSLDGIARTVSEELEREA